MTSTSAPLLDPALPILEPLQIEQLRQLDDPETLGTSGSIVSELIGLYLKDAPARVQRMSDALQNKNADQLRSEAHTLKSSSANLGLERMRALCKELEARGTRGDWEGTGAWLTVLQQELHAAQAALQALS